MVPAIFPLTTDHPLALQGHIGALLFHILLWELFFNKFLTHARHLLTGLLSAGLLCVKMLIPTTRYSQNLPLAARFYFLARFYLPFTD